MVQFNGYTAMKSSALYPASGDSDDYMYKLDIGIGKQGVEKLDSDQQTIIKLLKLHKGFLPYHDKSSPEDIYAFFAMSKKAFKMNVGILYKSKLITIEDNGIRLVDAPDNPDTPASALS
jgi:hypothetical protein